MTKQQRCVLSFSCWMLPQPLPFPKNSQHKGQSSSRLRSDPKSAFTSSSRSSSPSLSSLSSPSTSDPGPAKSLRLDWILRRALGFWWRAGRHKEQRRAVNFVHASTALLWYHLGLGWKRFKCFPLTTMHWHECVCKCVQIQLSNYPGFVVPNHSGKHLEQWW